MLPTKPFSSLKGMLPRIHHPLPLNEKSTKKLLDTLTSSFRKHLDREHGWLDDDAAEAAAAAATAKSVLGGTSASPGSAKTASMSSAASAAFAIPAAATLRPSSHAEGVGRPAQPPSASAPSRAHHRPTDRHLRSILANPLFSYDQSLGSQARAVGAERDPMDIFDWAVARGLMTPKRAAGCLLAKRREAVQSSHVSAKASMRVSGAGLKVLQWLQAAGLERDLAFVTDTQLTGVLVQFLVAEGLEAVVWDWIERLSRVESASASPSSASSTAFLLDRLVKATAAGAPTLDEAYQAMCRGAALFDKASPAFESHVFWPWCSLSWMSTFKAWNLARPSPRLYETFVAVMAHDDRPSIRLERAHLDLRHPTHPTPAPAVALLADDHLLRDVQNSTPAADPPPGRRAPAYRSRILSMGLDTVRHLAFVGQPDEAQRILDRLRQQFDAHLDQLPAHTSHLAQT